MMIEEKLLQRINQRITITENTLTKTYPLLKEPRILLTVLDNLYLIVNDIITYKIENKYRLLEREKKIEIYKKKFKKNLNLINEILDLWNKKNNSSIDFIRENQIYICSEDFEIRKLSEKDMKNFLNKIKTLIEED